jgi:hypothetical protein
MSTTKALKLALVSTAAILATGCASNSELRRVRDEAHSAQRVADQALTVAQEANTRSLRTEEMVDRSFRHTMRK